eukprot:Hpha_TRINITY_DN12960_c0_g1::TRINITY_DN12960_c0_g1_i1::g.164309::m.164309
MAAARRVQVLQSHLQSNLEGTLPRGGGAPSGQLVDSISDRPKWLLPLMVCTALGGAGVAAYKKRGALVEKVLPIGMKAVLWAMKGATAEDKATHCQRQLDAILSNSESVTPTVLATFRAILIEEFPVEARLRGIREKGLSREQKLSLWMDFQVFVLGRLVSAVYLLCLVHFVTRAVHALKPPTAETPIRDEECAELLEGCDVVGIARTVGRFCRASLESNSVDLQSKITSDKLLRLIVSVRRDVARALHLEAGERGGNDALGPLHEVVLGAEQEGESGDKHRLRDLLEANESKSVLVDCVAEFYAVIAQHLDEVFESLGRVSAGEEVSTVRLFPKLTPVFERVFIESDNEFLSALKGSDGDSTSDAFFLDLFQLQLESRTER